MKGTKEGEEIKYDDVYISVLFLQFCVFFFCFLGCFWRKLKTLKPTDRVLQYYTTVYSSAVGTFITSAVVWYHWCRGGK